MGLRLIPGRVVERLGGMVGGWERTAERTRPFASHLQEDASVRRDVVDPLLDLEHREEVWEPLQDVVEGELHLLGEAHAAVAAAAALGGEVGDVGKEGRRLLRHEVDLRIRVQAVGDGRLAVERLLNVLEVAPEASK